MAVDSRQNVLPQRRLDFEFVHHYNVRKKEISRLDELLEMSLSGDAPSSVILEAESGVGKSTLVENFLVDVVRSHSSEPLLGFAKFEERSTASEPFAAIVDLVDGVLNDITRRGLTSHFSTILPALLNAEAHILVDIMPKLAPLALKTGSPCFGLSSSKSSQASQCSVDFEAFGDLSKQEWRFERFRFAFRELIRCISKSRPLVLVLDDLQFADRDSMEVLSTLLDDNTKHRKLFFIGASRPIDDSDSSLRTLLFPKSRIRSQVEVVQLGGLNHGEIATFLEDIFRVAKSPKIEALADIVRRKSEGNAFVMVHFLRHLEKTGLIYFSESNKSWEWDCNLIRPHVDSSETVESTIAESINKLDESQRLLLITAASFGVSHFDISVIVHALRAVHDEGEDGTEQYSHHFVIRQDMSSVGHILDLSIRNGFVEELSPGHFKFSHDRTREVAYSLLPEGKARQQLHLDVGRRLRKWMDTEEEFGTSMSSDSLLLHTTKQLNAGSDLISDDWEKLDVAEMNFNAAEIAAKKSSFFTSMEYLQSGIAILGNNGWESHYGLMLKLRVALTRIQYSCGLFSECVSSADDVIANGKAFDDKKAVYNQKLFCLVQQERAQEGVDMILPLLKAMGHPVPKRFLTLYIVREYLKTSSFLQGMTDDDIRKLPEVHDPEVEYAGGLLHRVGELCWFGAPEIYFNYALMRWFAVLREKGHHPLTTPFALQLWGWTQFIEGGNLCECRRFCNLSMDMADRLCDAHPEERRRISLCRWYYSETWCEPLKDALEPISKTLKGEFAAGDLDIYYMDAWSILRQHFVCGSPLLQLEKDCQKLLEILTDYHQLFHWSISAPIAQAVSCLAGIAADPSVLRGDTISADDAARLEKSHIGHVVNQYQLFSMILAYHFGQFERAMSIAEKMERDIFAEGPEFLVATRVFYTALLNAALLLRTKRRKYRRRTKQQLKLLTGWVKNGASNCEYMKLLVEAELTRAGNKLKWEEVLGLYTLAIDSAANTKVVQHEALANELASEFLRSKDELGCNATSFLHRSIELYGEWQAMAKVQDLKDRYLS